MTSYSDLQKALREKTESRVKNKLKKSGAIESIEDTEKRTVENIIKSGNIPPKPSPKKFIKSLETSNPGMLAELKARYEYSNKHIPKSFEAFLEKEIKAIYFSPSKNETGFIVSDIGEIEETNYKTHENYALLANGEVVEYNLMGGGLELVKDKQFLGYGIFWEHNNLTK